MIRKENFAASTEDFAAGRKKVLEANDAELAPHITEALSKLGLPSWELQIVEAATRIFTDTARGEVDQWSQVLDDLRDAFAKELGDALKLTKSAANKQAQAETITRWVSTMAHNAGMEAAATSDTDTAVGLEWVTMGDSDVREPHRQANGQTVPSGHEFTVGGEKMLYPGQPVGDPSNWINCRCVARPTMLGEAAGKTLTASAAPGLTKDGKPPVCKYCSAPATQYVLHSEGMAYVPACDEHIQQAKDDAAATVPGGEPDPGNIDKVGTYSIREDVPPDAGNQVQEEPITSTVIVALPAASDPISAASSERSGAHATLLFLGDSAALDEEALKQAVSDFVTKGDVGIITEQVNGRATLGADAADVVLFDAANLVFIRKGLLEDIRISEPFCNVEQFPTWLPHVTLGYPETPAAGEFTGEAITFDRLALWHGESRTEYPLGGSIVPAEEPAQQSPAQEAVAALDALRTLTAAGIEVTTDPAPADAGTEDTAEEMASLEGAEAFAEVPWYGVLAPEGVPSGDGRMFSAGALTNRPLPLPLKFMWEDDEGHKGSFPIARIDRIWRENGLIKAEGVFDTSPQAYEGVRLLANGIMRGVSVDLDAAEVAAEGNGDTMEFSSGRICSATICAIPAFAEAFVAIGTWADAAPGTGETELPDPGVGTPTPPEAVAAGGTEAFDIPPVKTMDGPGWITEPSPTHRITSYWVDGRGAAKIGWGVPGDFNRCRANLAKYVQNPDWLAGLCANLHYRALGVWPGKASAETVEMHQGIGPAASLVAAAVPTVSADYFRNPMLEESTPVTLGEDGHIFGHLGTWDTCHIGYEVCTTIPPSATDYAYFLTGQVFTDAGPVAVGQLTVGGGHANGKVGVRAAIAHYDNVATAVADITVGEDAFGVWFSGKIRPWATEQQLHELFAAGPSGDWRPVQARGRNSMELVAAHAVNVQGFPVPRARATVENGRQMSLIAAGVQQAVPVVLDPKFVQQMDAYIAQQKRAESAASLSADIRQLRLAEITEQFTTLKGK